MYITVMGRGFECFLGDNGTLDTVFYVDGVAHTIDCDIAAEYRKKDGGFSASGFKKLCEWIILEEC